MWMVRNGETPTNRDVCSNAEGCASRLRLEAWRIACHDRIIYFDGSTMTRYFRNKGMDIYDVCVRIFTDEALLAEAMSLVEQINKRYDIDASAVTILPT